MNFSKEYNEKINETLFHGVTSSGLNVFVLPKKGFSKKYAVYAVNFGSCNISYSVNGKKYHDPLGVAHFLEHKLFELPDGRNAFDLFANTGASANAFTSHNMTAYLFSAADKFSESLEILLSYVNDPYFTDENVVKEQGIIAQEIKMYDDDPEWRLFNDALNCLYENNTVKDDIAGSVESISHITKDVLYNTYNTFYRPENMVLFVIGDVDENEVGALAEKYARPREKAEVIRDSYTEKDEVKSKYSEKKMDVSCDNFILSFKDNTPTLKGEELLIKNIETALILKLMFSRSSKLYNDLYENGIINSSFSYDTLHDEGYSCVMLGGEAKDVSKTVDALLKGIEDAKKNGFGKEDFERVKKSSLGRQIMAYNSIESVANSFCANYFSGIGAFDFVSAFSKVTNESVHKRIFEIFGDNHAVSVIKPLEK